MVKKFTFMFGFEFNSLQVIGITALVKIIAPLVV
jgi:hypothetical protein